MSTFTKENYNSPDGMLTTVWGPLVWHFLHIISFNYPVKPTPEDKQNYKNYLLSLGKILTCKYCRDNFAKNLKKAGFSQKIFKDRESFSKFIYKLHNEVNKMLNKSVDITYNEARDIYEHFRARCVNETPLIPRTKENGCLDPLYGIKSKCVINIVPKDSKKKSFDFDKKCKFIRKKSDKKK